MAEAVLVAGGGEGKIGNSRFAEGVVTGEDRESGRERRVEGSRGRRPDRGLLVTLNPRELASGVENHLLNLWRSSYWESHNQSHGVLEGRFEVVRRRGFELWVSSGIGDEGSRDQFSRGVSGERE